MKRRNAQYVGRVKRKDRANCSNVNYFVLAVVKKIKAIIVMDVLFTRIIILNLSVSHVEKHRLMTNHRILQN